MLPSMYGVGEAVQVVHEYRATSEDNSCLGVRSRVSTGVSGEKKQNVHLGSSR